MPTCAVLIPIYRAYVDRDEEFSIHTSLKNLTEWDTYFVAPSSLNTGYYSKLFPGLRIERFPDEFFNSIRDYNRLMLQKDFYTRFQTYEFVLICQPDAIVLQPTLDEWTSLPYDYIGAPWPGGYGISVVTERFSRRVGIPCFAFVGNGGLSLRRTGACLTLLQDFDDVVRFWISTAKQEDLFFSLVGSLSTSFRIPNIITALRFSQETMLDFCAEVTKGELPFGVHAWAKHGRSYWINIFSKLNLNVSILNNGLAAEMQSQGS